MTRHPVPFTPQNITEALRILKAGGLVAFPTETVYGLGADAANPQAVSKIFATKGRPANHPLIVHIGHVDQLEQWAESIPDNAYQLIDSFWPGPLAIILKKQPWVSDVVTGGQDTIAIRMPGNPVALDLLTQFNGGIAAPSANRFNHISPTLASHVQSEFGDSVEMIIDGGPCQVGLESTIIDVSSNNIKMLRPGHIQQQQIEHVLHNTVNQGTTDSTRRAPGMLELHYAPETPAALCPTIILDQYIEQYINAGKKMGVLVRHAQLDSHPNLHSIIMPEDPVKFGHDMYACLRQLDELQLDLILIEQLPDEPKWVAVNDRLLKATAGNICH